MLPCTSPCHPPRSLYITSQDIINRLSISEALKREKKFFSRHPSYSDVAYRCGSRYLAKTLNKVANRLFTHRAFSLRDI